MRRKTFEVYPFTRKPIIYFRSANTARGDLLHNQQGCISAYCLCPCFYKEIDKGEGGKKL